MRPEDAVERAAAVKETANRFFKDQAFAEAAAAYREALALLESSAESPGASELGKALRLNLATCLLRLPGASLHEAVTLCDGALEVDAESTKALFVRGSAQRGLAEASSEQSEKKTHLQSARKDLLQAARLKPQDRQVRQMLEEVTTALKELAQARGAGLSGAFLDAGRGLYDDRGDSDRGTEQVVCSECGREGHACCGKSEWVRRRAKWLGISEEKVGSDPASFEDNGTLMVLKDGQSTQEGRAVGSDADTQDDDLSDLSEEEREMLEDCLDSTDRPYPQIKKKLPLRQALHCAEQLWAEE